MLIAVDLRIAIVAALMFPTFNQLPRSLPHSKFGIPNAPLSHSLDPMTGSVEAR
jgi:hypothetical protein